MRRPKPPRADEPLDELAAVARYPARFDPASVPDGLRDNPLVRQLLASTPAQEATFDALARADEADDPETVARLLAAAK